MNYCALLVRIHLFALLLGLFQSLSVISAQAYTPPPSKRLDFNFNYDWKYSKGDVAGASATAFSDSGWQGVSLPHTWNDDKFREWIFLSSPVTAADPLRPSGTYYGIGWYRKHFTLDAAYTGRKIFIEFQGITLVGTFYVNGQSVGYNESGVAPAGIDITPYVVFGGDNVIAVQVNNNANYKTLGYNGANLPFGQPFNPNFGGINRDVTLHIMDPLYQTLPLYRNLGTLGTYIFPGSIDTLNKTATLTVQSEVKNDYTVSKAATFNAVVVDATGAVVLTLPAVSQTIAAGQKFVFNTTGNMTGVHFWDPTYPYLYQVYTTVSVGGTVVDTELTTTGIRKFTFAPTFGLEINGHPLYLNGYAPRCSMEWPAVGTPVDWLNEYDFLLMKQSNANFVRPMHIAPRKVQVEAADKFGIVMVVPAANNEGDDSDPNTWQERLDIMRDVTIYYRNNPSVLFYEACNQILTAQHMDDMLSIRETYDPSGGRLAGLRSNDSDVTSGIREFSCTMDGADNQLANPLWDAEYARGEAPRRVWDNYTPMLNPRRDGTANNPKYLTGGYFNIASDYHQVLGLNSGVGDFIGDYLFPIPQSSGNPTHAYFRLQNSEDMVLENLAKYYARLSRSVFVQDPAINASKGVMVGGAKIIWSDSVTDGRMHNTEVTRVSGAVDGARLPKEVFYGLQVAHASTPTLHIVGHWNYPTGTVKTVYVASNTNAVRLQTFDAAGNLVTDYGLGTKNFFPTNVLSTSGDQVNNYVFAFNNVAWQPGTIKATGYDDKGNVAGTPSTITTAGSPVALKLTPATGPAGQFRADGSDIAWFDVEAVDAQGQRCPTYEDTVSFSCSGAGTFLGGYNSGIRYSTNLANLTSGYSLNIECGINRVFVRSTRTAGTFTLNVTGGGLTQASASVTSVAVANPNGLSTIWPQKYTVPLGTEPTPVAEGVPPPPVSPAVPPAPATNIVDFGYSGGNTGANVIENVQAGQQIYVDKSNLFLPTLPSYLAGGEMIQPYQSDAGATSATDQYQFNITNYSFVYLVIDAANAMPANDNNADYQWQKLDDTMTINGRTMNIYKSRVMQPYENGYFADNGYGNSPFDPNSNMYLVFVKSIEQELQQSSDPITATSTQGTNTAAKAIDGNVSTRWNASSGTFPQVVTLDLEQAFAISGYTINWQSNATRYYQYKIETSTDNTNFIMSLDQQANKQMGLYQYRVPAVDVYDGSGNAILSRFVKITVTGGSGGAWAAIQELQINGVSASLLNPAVPAVTSPTTAWGALNTPFSYQITASGVPSIFHATGLPAGLSINTTTGLVTGTPTTVAVSPVTLTASNALGTSPGVTLTLNVTATPTTPSITSATAAPAYVGTMFNHQITASNSPTSFSASGLPAGLTVDTATGLISGTPTVTGTSSVTLIASNSHGTGSPATLTLTVNPATTFPTITSATSASGLQGGMFTYQMAANHTPTSYAATGLPAGLTLNTSTGLISGTPTGSGTSSVSLSASNASGTGPVAILTLTVAANTEANLAIGKITTATTFVAGNVATYATDGLGNTRWESAYADPQSIVIDLGQSDTIHAIVLNWQTAAGANYTLDVSNDNANWTNVQTVTGNPNGGAKIYAGLNATGRFVRMAGTTRTTTQYGYSLWEFQVFGSVGTVSKPVITSPLTASGQVGLAFSYAIIGSNSPTVYSATGLPPGLSINTSSGVISGTPTTSGSFNVTISATNAAGTGTATLVLAVIAADTNLALNKLPTASTFQAGNLVANANDGSSTTRWAAVDGTFPQWWQVDLGASKTLSRCDIAWYAAATRSYKYKIEVSTDNVNFTLFKDNTTNTTVGNTSDSNTATARYVRVTITGASAGFASAYEISVYGH